MTISSREINNHKHKNCIRVNSLNRTMYYIPFIIYFYKLSIIMKYELLIETYSKNINQYDHGNFDFFLIYVFNLLGYDVKPNSD